MKTETPVIFCIKEMARRHYDVDVEVLLIKSTKDYEAALFDNSCDVLIEHLEYLYPAGGDDQLQTAPQARWFDRTTEAIIERA
jgi:hypothetical protein